MASAPNNRSDLAITCFTKWELDSNGLWVDSNPLAFSLPLFLMQVSVVFITTQFTHYLLKPFKQPKVVTDIIGGILLGPSVLGRNKAIFSAMFPRQGFLMIDTVCMFALMFYLFLAGVKMDVGTVKRTGKKAWGIAFSSIIVPFFLIFAITKILEGHFHFVTKLGPLLLPLNAIFAFSPFPVVAALLTDLKLLTSELGHLATACSMICDVFAWIASAISLSSNIGTKSPIKLFSAVMSIVCLVLFIIFVMRPFLVSIYRRSPVGRPVAEIYVSFIILTVLILGLYSEVIGQRVMFGPFLLGLAVPDGPPLGETLVNRLESMVSGILLPLYIASSGLKTDVRSIQDVGNLLAMEVMVLFGTIGKILGVVLPCLYCKMSFRDALSLGLVMSSKGIIDLTSTRILQDTVKLSNETFSIMVITIALLGGVCSPLAFFIYRPSMNYAAYKRRTIEDSNPDMELRILACVINDEDVAPIIELLEASNPTKQSPIHVFVIHLVQLVGRAAPILQANKPNRGQPTRSDHITNAFLNFEQQAHHQDVVSIHSFTAVAPFVTMHDNICRLALNKRVSMIILPFHRHKVAGVADSESRLAQLINHNVLAHAPCSVGILIDRRVSQFCIVSSNGAHRIGVIFVGGRDDREALAYAMRMATNQDVSVTVVRFVATEEDIDEDLDEKKLDDDMIKSCRLGQATGAGVNTEYRQELVTTGEDTINVIRRMGELYDLFLVGMSRERENAVTFGLKEWCEDLELGAIGDYLASSDFGAQVSILVVQQQSKLRKGFASDFKDYSTQRLCKVFPSFSSISLSHYVESSELEKQSWK